MAHALSLLPLDVTAAGVPLVGTSGADYVYIPLVSGIVVLLLGAVLRWSTQGRTGRSGSRVADPAQGLLIGVVATTPPEAERIARLLTGAGLRTTSRAVASRRQVLVWPEDVDAALRIVADDRARRG